MRFAIVCPKDRPELYYYKFKKVIENEYTDIDADYMLYEEYTDVFELLKGKQLLYDVILFAGTASYQYAESKMSKEVLWHHIPLSGSAIYRALLKAMRDGMDIKKLSFDTYDEAMINEAYEELGIPNSQLSFKCIGRNFKNAKSNEDIFNIHKELYLNHETTGCITRLTKVGNLLEENKLPYVFASPNIDEFREQISFSKRLVLAKENAKNLFAVILVNVGLASDYVSTDMSNYSAIVEKNRLAEIVYRYAHMISGTVAECGATGYMIFTTVEILKTHTDMFKECVLLDWLGKETINLVSIGVGCGKTAEEARSHADVSLKKSIKKNKNCCIIMLNSEMVYELGEEKNAINQNNQMLEYSNRIADETGIGIETVIKLLQLVIRSSKNVYSSQELAEALSISRRSADRLIEKLEIGGYVASSGRRVCGKKGRPSRVVELFFEH